MMGLIERLTTFNPYATTKQEALQIEAADQLEAQQAEIAQLREAATEAEKMFRWYGDLHAAKPDPDKAARNYEMADKMAAALEQRQ